LDECDILDKIKNDCIGDKMGEAAPTDKKVTKKW